MAEGKLYSDASLEEKSSLSGAELLMTQDGATSKKVVADTIKTFTNDGRDLATDGAKLDGIESGADVTNSTNVAAAGAIMDTDYTANGLQARTNAGVYTSRIITGTHNQVNVLNGDGVSGNPALSLPQDLSMSSDVSFNNISPSGTVDGRDVAADGTKLDGIAAGSDITDHDSVAAAGAIMDTDYTANGVQIRTSSGSYASRDITGTIDQVNVLNGDGVSGNPTLSLPQDISASSDVSFNNISPSGTVDGRDVATDGTKLDGIEAGADVTNSTNVATAGAIMDSNYTSNGVQVRRANGGYISRVITGTANQVNVVDGDGFSGNPTLSLPQSISSTSNVNFNNILADGMVNGRDIGIDGVKLDGIETGADKTDALNVATAGAIMDSNYTSNGFQVRRANGGYISRVITGTANQVNVVNGDGFSGEPLLSLPQDIGLSSTVEFGSLTLNAGNSPGLRVGGVLAGDDRYVEFGNTAFQRPQIGFQNSTNSAIFQSGQGQMLLLQTNATTFGGGTTGVSLDTSGGVKICPASGYCNIGSSGDVEIRDNGVVTITTAGFNQFAFSTPGGDTALIFDTDSNNSRSPFYFQNNNATNLSDRYMSFFFGAYESKGIRFYQNGGLVVGAATGYNKGYGTINCQQDIYKNGTKYNNPDYVFEKYFTSKIERFKDNDGAEKYKGLLSLDKLKEHIKSNLRLPGVGDQEGIFDRSDIILEKIEEAFLYILEMNSTIELLQKKVGEL